jgi:hypothetical protein
MNCNINPSLLDGLIDDQLDNQQRFEINTHVVACHDCQQQLNQLRQAKSVLSAMQPPPMSSNFELKLKQKIAAANDQALQQSNNVFRLGQSATSGRRPILSLLAMAASVTVAVTGLSWFMMQNPQGADLLALDGQNIIIEINTPAFPAGDIKLASLQTVGTQGDNQGFWTDAEMDNFDQFTQPDSGYQGFSCGSTSGERGCSLGPGNLVASLTVKSSI